MSLRLWGLDEIMRQYNVWQLAKVIEFLSKAELDAEQHSRMIGIQRVPDDQMNNFYTPMLRYSRGQLEFIELPAALARLDHFNNEIRQGISWSELRNQMKVLREAIEAELPYRRFAYVPTPKAMLHDKFRLDWEPIWTKFPNAKEDTERAVDCYALEQNTACVVHFMRVAEIGLRDIAKKVGVKLKDKGKWMPIEFATWDKVINGIKAKLTQAHAMSKSVRKNQKLQFYSDAADQCTYFRDLWRNDAAHGRKQYDEGEALSVMTRVREFMQMSAKSM
jgi:hypothetical protein